jgi:hypothetical protein
MRYQNARDDFSTALHFASRTCVSARMEEMRSRHLVALYPWNFRFRKNDAAVTAIVGVSRRKVAVSLKARPLT